MDKPKSQSKMGYDYHDCVKYIEEKHGYKTRDFANCASVGFSDKLPYQDFWHWICDQSEIHNGCYFTLTQDTLEWAKEDWVKTILGHFLDEFGDETVDREITFWVEW